MTILEDLRERYPIEYEIMIWKYCPFISRVGDHGSILPAYCMGKNCIAFGGKETKDNVIMPHCLRLISPDL